MRDDFWDILHRQPDVGVAIIDVLGRVRFANPQLRRIYGWEGDPVGKTIGDLEGAEFEAERLPIYREVAETLRPALIRHIRQGRYTETTVWPLKPEPNVPPRVLSIVRQGLPASPPPDWRVHESRLVHLGPLNLLTPRELAVMAHLGSGTPLKVIASELRLSLRSVERYRTVIARKLGVSSLAEIARLVSIAGLKVDHAHLTRLPRHPR